MKLGRLTPLLALLIFTLVSCTGDPVGQTFPVKGKVTVGGKTLTTGSVAFWADEAKGTKLAFTPASQIAEDGSYDLFTNGKRGAPAGHYKVTIVAQAIPDSTAPEKTKSLVPDIYAKKETTTVLIEVVADGSKTYDLTAK